MGPMAAGPAWPCLCWPALGREAYSEEPWAPEEAAEGRKEAVEVGSTKGEATSEVEAPTPTAEASGKPQTAAKPKRRSTGNTQHQRVVHMLPPTPSSAGAAGEAGAPELPEEKEEEGGRGEYPTSTEEEAGAAAEHTSG